MRIILIGYGKMGRELEKTARARGHEIAGIITTSNRDRLTHLETFHADVVIEFTTPDSAVENILHGFKAGLPVVTGTTGWYDRLPQVREACLAGGHTLMYASNFSIGVNILFEMNRILANVMNQQPDYDVFIEEIHHTQKLDSPSGTAITIAGDILQRLDRKKRWIETEPESNDDAPGHPGDLTIHSMRMGSVIGTHIIKYISDVDEIELRHEAKSRAGFVMGALVAAEWIAGRKGIFTMQDLLRMDQKEKIT